MRSLIFGLTRPRQAPRVSAAGLGALFIASILLVAVYDRLRPHNAIFAGAGGDFRAFYCAGEVLARHADPYQVEPLRSCELRVQPLPGWSRDVVDPAPFPGYALLLFEGLSHLPYMIAKAVWFAGLLASIFTTAWILAQLTAYPALLLLLSLSLLDGFISLVYGQLPPLVTLAVAAAAYFTERSMPVRAALCAVGAMIEPHVGLVACASLFVWMPGTRPTLLVSGIILAAMTVVATGFSGIANYLTTVIPGQASAELVAVDQWSLSHALHVLGFSDAAALRIGSLSYVMMAFIGIVVAGRAAVALDARSLIAAVPPAAVLLGGSYMHEIQLAIAMPAAFILSERATRFRAAAQAGLLLLVFPWFSLAVSRAALTAVSSAIALSSWIWLRLLATTSRRRGAGVVAVPIAAFVLLLAAFHRLPAPQASAEQTPFHADRARTSAVDNWGAYLRSQPDFSVSSVRKEFEKVPSWLALVLIVVAAGTQSKRVDPTLQRRIEEPVRVSEVHARA